MAYKIVNPSAGNDYYDVAGTATTATTQPNVLIGVAKALGSDETLLNNLGHGINMGVYGSKLVGGNHMGTIFWGSSVALTSVAAAGGYARYTLNAHGRSVGDVINVTDTNNIVQGTQRITAVNSSSTFTTTKPYVSGAGTLAYRLSSGNFAVLTPLKYVMRRVSTELAGLTKTILRSGASDFGVRRSIHKLEAMRTNRVATAIRAGYWDEYNGVFTTKPTNNNDISDFGTDHAATPTRAVPGELVYKTGKPLPVQANYPEKTGS